MSNSGGGMCPGCRASPVQRNGLNGFCALTGKDMGRKQGTRYGALARWEVRLEIPIKKSGPSKMTTSVDE